MSNKYKFLNPDGVYFVSFATVYWADIFTRNEYRDIVVNSLTHCMQHKGLNIHAYVIMTNHIHLIISRSGNEKLEEIMRDFKKFTSYKLLGAIMENIQESRKEWLISLFEKAGAGNSNNSKYQLWQQ